MIEKPDIKYLPREAIDDTKWDACIGNAGNGLIYANSFYLDTIADNWDALVMNDYEAVMPLTWRKKYGIYYLYQPFLVAQSGLFGKMIDAKLLDSFLKAIPGKFRYWDINLNWQNCFQLRDFKIHQRNNFVLDLERPYEKIYEFYSENVKRNIRKAEQLGCAVKKDFDVEIVITAAKEQMKSYVKEAKENVVRFKKLFNYLHGKQQAITYGIFSPQHKLLSSCIFFFSHHRAYYILVGNHPESKTTGASHTLIDAFIKDHCGQKLVLDFEGSEIPGLANFYSSFGAAEEKYAAIRLNRLPFYLRWIKK